MNFLNCNDKNYQKAVESKEFQKIALKRTFEIAEALLHFENEAECISYIQDIYEISLKHAEALINSTKPFVSCLKYLSPTLNLPINPEFVSELGHYTPLFYNEEVAEHIYRYYGNDLFDTLLLKIEDLAKEHLIFEIADLFSRGYGMHQIANILDITPYYIQKFTPFIKESDVKYSTQHKAWLYLQKTGVTISDIAKEYDVSIATINKGLKYAKEKESNSFE